MNSELASFTIPSPNRNPRNHKIDTITIHCMAGNMSARNCCEMFQTNGVSSSNYVIGYDGTIAVSVDEEDRSWASSDRDNDHRAVTIECASDSFPPYTINPKVYHSLILLCADICKRNGILQLLWKGNKSLIGQIDKQNMTVHRWFANKACPGDYIYERLGEIAKEVNTMMSKETSVTSSSNFKVQVGIPDLHIRTGAGTNHPSNGFTGVGVFTIVRTSDGQGSSKGWGLLKSYEQSQNGWISLDYAEKL